MEQTPLKPGLARQAGAATVWKAIQVGGVKFVFFIRLVLLARLLTPGDYGLFAIALGALTLAASTTNLGILESLVQRRSPAREDYDAAWSVGLVRGLLLAGILAACAPLVALVFGESRATDVIRVIAIVPIIDGLASVKLANAVKELRFNRIALVELSKAAIITVVAVLLAPALGVWALLAGQLAGSLAYVVGSYVAAPYRPSFRITFRAVQPLVRFGRWILLTGLIAESGNLALRAVVSHSLGTAELGLYFMAASIAYLPIALLSETIGAVAFPVYSRVHRESGDTQRLFRAVLVSMLVAVIPAACLMATLAPWIMGDLLGDQWSGATAAFRILSFVCVAGLMGEVLTPVFLAIGRPDFTTRLEALQTATTLVLAVWLAATYGLAGIAVAALVGTLLPQPLAVRLSRHALPSLPGGLGPCILASVLSSLVASIAAFWLARAIGGVPGLAAAGLLGGGFVAVVLWATDRRFALGITDDLAHALPPLSILKIPVGRRSFPG